MTRLSWTGEFGIHMVYWVGAALLAAILVPNVRRGWSAVAVTLKYEKIDRHVLGPGEACWSGALSSSWHPGSYSSEACEVSAVWTSFAGIVVENASPLAFLCCSSPLDFHLLFSG